MATITNYAVIDHIGMVEDVKSVYSLAYKRAKIDGFTNNDAHQIWKMKEIIATMSNDRTKDNSTKWAVRHTKNPKLVYIICNSIESNKYLIKNAIECWKERDIPVAIISEQDGYIAPEEEPEYDFGLQISRYRECALIWSKALGWSFSYPLVINHQMETTTKTADPYTKRKKDEQGSYSAKRFSSAESFEKHYRVAPESECEAFFEHYKFLWANNLLADSLECDYVLCPTCGRPVRVNTSHEAQCNHCDTHIESEIVDTYYDDSYKEDSDLLD